MTWVIFKWICRVINRYLSPSVTCHPRAAAHNSASAVDNADKAALLERHVMIVPAQQMTSPFCDL
eukprot:2270229-Karenia_brevis.AAC.1